jgi:hypothetical protein
MMMGIASIKPIALLALQADNAIKGESEALCKNYLLLALM